MKQITTRLVASLLVLVLVIGSPACKKDNKTETESAKITLTVNGENFEPYLIQDADIGFGLFVVGSFSDGQHILSLNFDSDITEGSHDMGNLDSAYGMFWDKVNDINSGNIERYTSKSGSLVVEEYSAETGRLKGTFNATCATSDNKTVTVTNGIFLVFL
ncbi:MAG: hypothetical protein A2W85_07840 [Bacteroidetes bacterium GWF2_41_31]|nr:MAG: hypothetical protein A2W85_07840 [Bacteroidetes bacterium GWF2_41_31]